MGYRLLPNGVIEADTADEILALRGKVGGAPMPADSTPATAKRTANKTASNGPWQSFLKIVERRPAMVKLLTILKSHGSKPLTNDEVQEAMGVESKAAVGGSMSGILKAAKKVGIDPASVIVREKVRKTMRAGAMLLQNDLPKS